MRNLIVVAFLEPVTTGMVFPRDAWPMHITLVKFDAVELPPGTGGGNDGGGDLLCARMAGLMDAPVRAALGTSVPVGGHAGFGRDGSVPVSLIEPSAALQALHEALVGAVGALPGRVATPGYTLTGYRPHVSHRGTLSPLPGAQLALDRIALVDMAPDGGHTTRRVVTLWDATL